MNTTACTTVAPTNTTNRGSGVRHDELRADDARQEADDRLRQAADPDDAARQRVLHQAGDRAGQQPGHRPRRQRDVHDDDEHEVDRRRARESAAREGRLEHDGRRRSARSTARRLHCGLSAAAAASPRRRRRRARPARPRGSRSRPPAGPRSRRYAPPLFSTASTWPMTNPFGIDAVDAGRHDEVARRRRRRLRTRIPCAGGSSPAPDHDALRARPFDERAGRGVAIDEQLHLGGARGSARRRARRRRRAR